MLRIDNLDSMPLYEGDDISGLLEPRLMADGSLTLQELYVTKLRPDNYRDVATVVTERKPIEQEWIDMYFAWCALPRIRSNGVDIVREEATLAVGTGKQGRILAIEDALRTARRYNGDKLPGSVLGSDAFMLADNVKPLNGAGVSAIIQPGGGNGRSDAYRRS